MSVPESDLDLDLALRAADAPRPLPEGLAERIAGAAQTFSDPVVVPFRRRFAPEPVEQADINLEPEFDGIEIVALSTLERARPLPTQVRGRLEAILLAESQNDMMLAGLDEPRPLPRGLRERLEMALAPRRRRRYAPPWRAISGAAAAALLVMSFGAVSQLRSGGQPPRAPEAAAGLPDLREGFQAIAPAPGVPASQVSFGSAPGTPDSPAPSYPVSSGDRSLDALAPGVTAPAPAYDAPPFTGGFGRSAPLQAPGSAAAPAPPLAPLTFGLVPGDPDIAAGFHAYARLLNERGGAGGHRFEFTAAGVGRPAPPHGTIGTINLSKSAVATSSGAPAWVRTPLIETLAVPDVVLVGDVYDFSSAPERQARIAVSEIFPIDAPGKVAVVYVEPQGIFSRNGEVGQTFQTSLSQRRVAAVFVTYEPEGKTPIVPHADAVFFSLESNHAREVLRAAGGSDFTARRGIAGVYPLLDESLISLLPPQVRVLSPYSLPSSGEAAALRRLAQRPNLNAQVIHGWVTAKMLALAVWYSNADTPAELGVAIDALRGYGDAFAQSYDVRFGTNSRSLVAVEYGVEAGRFVQRSQFRQDDT